MFTQRPAESGDHMYLDFTKLSSLKSNLLRDKAVSEREKERLELQIAKLATNTQTETVVSDLKRISAELDGQLEAAKRLVSILERVAEIYSQGEDRITEHIEDGEEPEKKSFVSYQSNPDADVFRRLLN